MANKNTILTLQVAVDTKDFDTKFAGLITKAKETGNSITGGLKISTKETLDKLTKIKEALQLIKTTASGNKNNQFKFNLESNLSKSNLALIELAKPLLKNFPVSFNHKYKIDIELDKSKVNNLKAILPTITALQNLKNVTKVVKVKTEVDQVSANNAKKKVEQTVNNPAPTFSPRSDEYPTQPSNKKSFVESTPDAPKIDKRPFDLARESSDKYLQSLHRLERMGTRIRRADGTKREGKYDALFDNLVKKAEQQRKAYASSFSTFADPLPKFDAGKFSKSAYAATNKAGQDASKGFLVGFNNIESGVAAIGKNTSGTFSRFFQASFFGDLAAGAVRSLIGAFKSITVETTIYAARTEELGVVLDSLARVNDISTQSIIGQEVAVKRLNITTQDARETLARFINVGFDTNKASPLARVAQDLAVIGNLSTSEELNKLTVGIQTLQSRNLRSAGVYITVDEVLDKLSATSGRARDSFSTLEKQEAVLNAVLEYGTKVAGTYEAAMGTVSKQMRSLERQFYEAQNAIGASFIPALGVAVTSSGYLLDTVAKYPGIFNGAISVIGAFSIALIALKTNAIQGLAVSLASTFSLASAKDFGKRLGGGETRKSQDIALNVAQLKSQERLSALRLQDALSAQKKLASSATQLQIEEAENRVLSARKKLRTASTDRIQTESPVGEGLAGAVGKIAIIGGIVLTVAETIKGAREVITAATDYKPIDTSFNQKLASDLANATENQILLQKVINQEITDSAEIKAIDVKTERELSVLSLGTLHIKRLENEENVKGNTLRERQIELLKQEQKFTKERQEQQLGLSVIELQTALDNTAKSESDLKDVQEAYQKVINLDFGKVSNAGKVFEPIGNAIKNYTTGLFGSEESNLLGEANSLVSRARDPSVVDPSAAASRARILAATSEGIKKFEADSAKATASVKDFIGLTKLVGKDPIEVFDSLKLKGTTEQIAKQRAELIKLVNEGKKAANDKIEIELGLKLPSKQISENIGKFVQDQVTKAYEDAKASVKDLNLPVGPESDEKRAKLIAERARILTREKLQAGLTTEDGKQVLIGINATLAKELSKFPELDEAGKRAKIDEIVKGGLEIAKEFRGPLGELSDFKIGDFFSGGTQPAYQYAQALKFTEENTKTLLNGTDELGQRLKDLFGADLIKGAKDFNREAISSGITQFQNTSFNLGVAPEDIQREKNNIDALVGTGQLDKARLATESLNRSLEAPVALKNAKEALETLKQSYNVQLQRVAAETSYVQALNAGKDARDSEIQRFNNLTKIQELETQLYQLKLAKDPTVERLERQLKVEEGIKSFKEQQKNIEDEIAILKVTSTLPAINSELLAQKAVLQSVVDRKQAEQQLTADIAVEIDKRQRHSIDSTKEVNRISAEVFLESQRSERTTQEDLVKTVLQNNLASGNRDAFVDNPLIEEAVKQSEKLAEIDKKGGIQAIKQDEGNRLMIVGHLLTVETNKQVYTVAQQIYSADQNSAKRLQTLSDNIVGAVERINLNPFSPDSGYGAQPDPGYGTQTVGRIKNTQSQTQVQQTFESAFARVFSPQGTARLTSTLRRETGFNAAYANREFEDPRSKEWWKYGNRVAPIMDAGMLSWNGDRRAQLKNKFLPSRGKTFEQATPKDNADFVIYELLNNPAYKKFGDVLRNPKASEAQVAAAVKGYVGYHNKHKGDDERIYRQLYGNKFSGSTQAVVNDIKNRPTNTQTIQNRPTNTQTIQAKETKIQSLKFTDYQIDLVEKISGKTREFLDKDVFHKSFANVGEMAKVIGISLDDLNKIINTSSFQNFDRTQPNEYGVFYKISEKVKLAFGDAIDQTGQLSTIQTESLTDIEKQVGELEKGVGKSRATRALREAFSDVFNQLNSLAETEKYIDEVSDEKFSGTSRRQTQGAIKTAQLGYLNEEGSFAQQKVRGEYSLKLQDEEIGRATKRIELNYKLTDSVSYYYNLFSKVSQEFSNSVKEQDQALDEREARLAVSQRRSTENLPNLIREESLARAEARNAIELQIEAENRLNETYTGTATQVLDIQRSALNDRLKAHTETIGSILKLEEDTAHSQEGIVDRLRLKYAQLANDRSKEYETTLTNQIGLEESIKRKDEPADATSIQQQREKLLTTVNDLKKSTTDVLGDFYNDSFKAISGGFDSLIDKTTKKLGIFGGAVGSLLKGIVNRPIADLFKTITDKIAPRDPKIEQAEKDRILEIEKPQIFNQNSAITTDTQTDIRNIAAHTAILAAATSSSQNGAPNGATVDLNKGAESVNRGFGMVEKSIVGLANSQNFLGQATATTGAFFTDLFANNFKTTPSTRPRIANASNLNIPKLTADGNLNPPSSGIFRGSSTGVGISASLPPPSSVKPITLPRPPAAPGERGYGNPNYSLGGVKTKGLFSQGSLSSQIGASAIGMGSSMLGSSLSGLGGSSKTGGVLGGLAGSGASLLGGLVGSSVLAGTGLTGGAVGSLAAAIGISGAATLGIGAAIIGAFALGSYLFGRAKRRKEEKATVATATTDAISKLKELLKAVRGDKTDGDGAMQQAADIRAQFVEATKQLKTKPGKAAAAATLTQMDGIIGQIKTAAAAQTLRKETDLKIVPTYAGGGMSTHEYARVSRGETLVYPTATGTGSYRVPGSFDSRDNILMQLPVGTVIRNPVQQHYKNIRGYASGTDGIGQGNSVAPRGSATTVVNQITSILVLSEEDATRIASSVPGEVVIQKAVVQVRKDGKAGLVNAVAKELTSY